jgi:hypothetical protein
MVILCFSKFQLILITKVLEWYALYGVCASKFRI